MSELDSQIPTAFGMFAFLLYLIINFISENPMLESNQIGFNKDKPHPWQGDIECEF